MILNISNLELLIDDDDEMQLRQTKQTMNYHSPCIQVKRVKQSFYRNSFSLNIKYVFYCPSPPSAYDCNYF